LLAEDFHLNGGNGRCSICLGTGAIAEDGAAACCSACGGRRYRHAALATVVAGLDMAATLELPVTTLRSRWEEVGEAALLAQLGPLCTAMEKLGVGHLAFGRRVDTLSGGEMQRLRVALTLAQGETVEGHVFILDEPAAGLHREDAMRLNAVLRSMADGGRNTVVLIEHNLDVIAESDWLVEFGEGAGERGGKVLIQAPPAEVAAGTSPTGRALRTIGRAHKRAKTSSPIHSSEFGPASTAIELEKLVDGNIDHISAVKAAPAVSAYERLLEPKRRLWEIGDLNLELAKLLIDDLQTVAARDEAALLERWNAEPAAELAVNPLLPDLRQWGPRLPRCVTDAAVRRVQQLDLRMPGAWDFSRPGEVRAMLDRPDKQADRRDWLRHALAVGAGYTELRRSNGEVLATVRRSLVDLDRGLAGPNRIAPTHMSRFEPEGKCSACGGTGTVHALAPRLVFANTRAAPEDLDAYLRPEAASLLKGVWRGEFRPFLRRMIDEGLMVDASDTDWIRLGYWHRPGHGSFLKTAKADPDEVGSWLVWDGLYTRLLAELPRSRHPDWRSAVEASLRQTPCPMCEGIGHSTAVRLLTLRGRSLDTWIRSGTIGELYFALQMMPLDWPRQQHTRDRVLCCFEPLVRRDPGSLLLAPAAAYPEVAQETMRRFSDLEYRK